MRKIILTLTTALYFQMLSWTLVVGIIYLIKGKMPIEVGVLGFIFWCLYFWTGFEIRDEYFVDKSKIKKHKKGGVKMPRIVKLVFWFMILTLLWKLVVNIDVVAPVLIRAFGIHL